MGRTCGASRVESGDEPPKKTPTPPSGATPGARGGVRGGRDGVVHGRSGGTALGPFPTWRYEVTSVVGPCDLSDLPAPVNRRASPRVATRPASEGQYSRYAAIHAGEQGGTALGPFPTTVVVHVKVHGRNFAMERTAQGFAQESAAWLW
jgi:hypothetical protein